MTGATDHGILTGLQNSFLGERKTLIPGHQDVIDESHVEQIQHLLQTMRDCLVGVRDLTDETRVAMKAYHASGVVFKNGSRYLTWMDRGPRDVAGEKLLVTQEAIVLVKEDQSENLSVQ